MRPVEIRPTRKFGGGWIAFEGPGVEPVFAGPDGKRDAINYARGRFGGGSGEIPVSIIPRVREREKEASVAARRGVWVYS